MRKTLSSDVLIWVAWTLVSAVAVALGFAVSIVIMPLFGWPGLMWFVLAAFIPGLFIGLGQWLIVRRSPAGTWIWIAATSIGIPLGMLVGYCIFAAIVSISGMSVLDVNEGLADIGIGCIAGLIVGACQRLSLVSESRSIWNWIAVSGVSYGLGTSLPFLFLRAYPAAGSASGSWLWILAGLLAGAITGAVSGTFIRRFILDAPALTKGLHNESMGIR